MGNYQRISNAELELLKSTIKLQNEMMSLSVRAIQERDEEIRQLNNELISIQHLLEKADTSVENLKVLVESDGRYLDCIVCGKLVKTCCMYTVDTCSKECHREVDNK